jgi:hypothetical protein
MIGTPEDASLVRLENTGALRDAVRWTISKLAHPRSALM